MSSQIPKQAPPGTDNKRRTLKSLADLGSIFQTEAPEPLPVNDHKNTYNLVALMMYLVGVEYRHFETHDPPLTENFKRHEQNKNARIMSVLGKLASIHLPGWEILKQTGKKLLVGFRVKG